MIYDWLVLRTNNIHVVLWVFNSLVIISNHKGMNPLPLVTWWQIYGTSGIHQMLRLDHRYSELARTRNVVSWNIFNCLIPLHVDEFFEEAHMKISKLHCPIFDDEACPH